MARYRTFSEDRVLPRGRGQLWVRDAGQSTYEVGFYKLKPGVLKDTVLKDKDCAQNPSNFIEIASAGSEREAKELSVALRAALHVFRSRSSGLWEIMLKSATTTTQMRDTVQLAFKDVVFASKEDAQRALDDALELGPSRPKILGKRRNPDDPNGFLSMFAADFLPLAAAAPSADKPGLEPEVAALPAA